MPSFASAPFLFAIALTACAGSPEEGVAPDCTGEAPNEYSIALDSDDFVYHAGMQLNAVTEIGLVGGESCRGANATTIDPQGHFDVRVVNRTDDAVYPVVAAFIDIDENGRCDGEVDLVWMRTEVLVGPELSASLGVEDFRRGAGTEGCGYF
jgi:hypothetical protein